MLTNLNVGHFEVIQTTGATEGPRSPGAPIVNAGTDAIVHRGEPVTLTGAVTYTNVFSLTTAWRMHSGPAAVSFDDASRTNTTATFTAPGVYTLMLSASNGIHTTAHDVAVFAVVDPLRVSITRSSSNALLRWAGGLAPFAVEATDIVPSSNWVTMATVNTNNATVPMTNASSFFRVRQQP
jgi:hypothetical protein